MDYYVSKGYKGFVLEGTGFGHVPTNGKNQWISTIKKITKKGIPVVIAAQTLYGRVNTNVYANLRILFHDAGAIPGEDMLPEVAFVKLGWVLGHTKKFEEVKKLMLKNIAGEITERSRVKVD
jgi:glutamyl-tRNA(Gln) amidotransferase subunit D